MADSDKELTIHIATTTDMSGINAASAGLDTLKGAQNAESTATEAATAATAELSLGKRELLEAMRPLIQQFPVLGEVARAAFNPITIITFGLIGAFELLKNRTDEMVGSLGAVQLPDLSDGIRQAQDLATAWEAVAKAVRDADAAFTSVEQTTARGNKGTEETTEATKKNLEVQKELGLITPQQYRDRVTQAEIAGRQAELSNQFNASANYKSEGDRAKAQADAITKQFGLGQNDDEEAAHKKATQDIIDSKQKSIDQSRANIALLNEATDPTTGELTGDFDWAKLIAHYGGRVTTPGGFAEAMQIEQQNINQQEADQKGYSKQISTREEATKQRDDLLKKSAASYGKGETASNDANYQNNPNNVGSVAWQNTQARGTMSTQDHQEFDSDIAQLRQAMSTHAPVARKTMEDIKKTLQDAVNVMQSIADGGEDVTELKRTVALVQAQVSHLAVQGIH